VSYTYPIALTLHLLATIIWVGGMFFAHMALRQEAARLEPAERLPLLAGVFRRFFTWVWIAVVTLLVTGFWMLFAVFGGFGGVGVHIHMMLVIGLLMSLLFLYLYTIPYRRMLEHLATGVLPGAASDLARIRAIVLTNLILGLTTTVIATLGRLVAFSSQ
jgi:uncharacterized membrane protein